MTGRNLPENGETAGPQAVILAAVFVAVIGASMGIWYYTSAEHGSPSGSTGPVEKAFGKSEPAAVPAFHEMLVEAESGTVDLPFKVVRAPIADNFGGGEYVDLPDNVNPKSGFESCMTSSGKRPVHPGKVTVTVTIPEAGDYYLFARMRIPDSCADSALFSFGNSKAVYYMSGTPNRTRFQWLSVKTTDPKTGRTGSMPIHLEKGRLAVSLLNSEDGIAADQFLLTANPAFVPPDKPLQGNQ